MNIEQTLQATQLALQACQQQRESLANQVIDLRVELTLAQHRLTELTAQVPKRRKPKLEVVPK